MKKNLLTVFTFLVLLSSFISADVESSNKSTIKKHLLGVWNSDANVFKGGGYPPCISFKKNGRVVLYRSRDLDKLSEEDFRNREYHGAYKILNKQIVLIFDHKIYDHNGEFDSIIPRNSIEGKNFKTVKLQSKLVENIEIGSIKDQLDRGKKRLTLQFQFTTYWKATERELRNIPWENEKNEQ